MTKNGPYLAKDVKALSAGLQFWGKYIINDKNQRKTRDGREIVNLKLGDPSGEIEVVVWENCQVAGTLEKGCIVGLLGDTGMYNGRLQVTAKRIKILDEDPLLYLRSPSVAREVLTQQLDQVIDTITDPHLFRLLATVLSPEQKKAFAVTPAAKRVHHHYLGGLLEHTLNVVRLCDQAVEAYPSLNRDLLITGAVLHDIGKIQEYELKILPEYTLPGKMMGHIVLGHDIIEKAIMDMRRSGYVFPEILEIMVKHMILSHHGTLEFGSPVKPLFPEAFLLHMMDNLDAKMYVYFEKMGETDNLDHFMTPYDGFHQQQFFTYRYSSPAEERLSEE